MWGCLEVGFVLRAEVEGGVFGDAGESDFVGLFIGG